MNILGVLSLFEIIIVAVIGFFSIYFCWDIKRRTRGDGKARILAPLVIGILGTDILYLAVCADLGEMLAIHAIAVLLCMISVDAWVGNSTKV